MRYREHKKTGKRRRNICKRRTTQEVYSKKVIWIGGQEIQSGILKRNWRCWKGEQVRSQISIKEENKQEKFKVKQAKIWEQAEEDSKEIANIKDPYDKLQKNLQDKKP